MGDRRRVVLVTTLVLGTVLLGVSLRIEPGTVWFYPAALALAAVWAGGALLAGPPTFGDRSPVRPVLVGLALGAVFVVGALVVREIPALDDAVGAVTAYADRGSGPLVVLVAVVTGLSEELYFRGALYDALPRPVLATTLVYAVVTVATGNVMLVFASVLLGLVAAAARRHSGGVVAPCLVHATWSVVLLLALPRLF
ncbi:CPBP family intramembrane metalloprotease [Nocardioides sp. CGMCC 1.13656]|uniref:CPBP family intramembrane glutamic endopeptidase n=1 Tax=Nocardioides TaxID=1839 RepID=UPI0012FCCB02|nr:CPBP family intramembrane glutamic endopeptidase [Nocardioides sp. CGMCC 1.13656]MBA2954927.1 CPBP family intramembrane metalloprotease [Nocardioides sp. CGMCC 1.13656]